MLDCYTLSILSLSLTLSIIIIIIIIIIITIIISIIKAIQRKKKKQRGGSVGFLITKQCGHVYMHFIFVLTFICLYVCFVFWLFLLKNFDVF